MNVYIKFYKLHALKALNRLSQAGERRGVHLKVKMRFTEQFADYFPHTALGDKECDEFLQIFKYQDNEYEKKVFHFLLNDERLRSQRPKVFLNHELWDGQTEAMAPFIKYKLKGPDDFSFMALLKKGLRVRLDANGFFDRVTLDKFLSEIPKDFLPKLEYIEDPTTDKDWSFSQVPSAQDFISGSPYQFYIHKPNARFLNEQNVPVIFSSYLGSDLGRYQAYTELLEKGDLKITHGIITNNFYVEEKLKFQGSYLQGFTPDEVSVRAMYNELSFGEWKLLCSI